MPPERRGPAWLNTEGSPKARRPARHVRAAAPSDVARRPAAAAAKRPRADARAAPALSENARVVLERRYLTKDARGRATETPEDLFRRVARTIAAVEGRYAAPARADAVVRDAEARFYELMTSLRFLPNSPTLGNAGRPLQQLSACFVLPIEDSMEGIFETLKETALIHQSGGGTGFAFSRLRPAGDRVATTGGIASGPVSFMRVFDAATESIKQGGTRRGANMAILSVEHPDIETFINVKSDMTTLQNFNISVAVNERFMEAVEHDATYELVNPRTGKPTGERRARDVFRQVVENAWRNGDPGLVFLDRINRDNPTPALGRIEATNPCGEQPLLPYESCNLGSINLAKFVRPPAPAKGRRNGAAAEGELDWDALGDCVRLAVRFLDDVIDANVYPIPAIDEMTKRTRKVGLGVMGWADVLFALRIPYDSEEALALGGRVMEFVQRQADAASVALAEERGVFPAWHGSVYDPASGDQRAGPRYRNATRTTVAPTGTLSIIADCSGGIEPAFALAFMRQHHLDRKDPGKVTRLPEVNHTFREIAEREGFWSDALAAFLAAGGPLRERRDVPAWAKNVFVTSHDIGPEWHVRMQAAFQRHTDNAVSKTINFRHEATVEDVERAYLLAYREGCKGITVYRDGSRAQQVLSHVTARGPEQAEAAAAEIALGFSEVLDGAASGGGMAKAPYRKHLPDERRSITHKFRVGEQEGYITAGLYEDGQPGEIFVRISKEGSTISGLMDSVAVLTSVALQYGVPLRSLVDKFRGVHFEPNGLTSNPRVPVATSVVDYIFRWLESRFLEPPGAASESATSGKKRKVTKRAAAEGAAAASPANAATSTGLGCPDCGAILVFTEGCLVCPHCGYNKCG
ncbi:MAG TPA: vitamin B12-dependent ribonucleotide reductase [Dehalococcoidia bacterium]|nr:vitamin B12-dependent ribonucleotide reductase [Dehalococcoidia bacterium]